MVRIKKYNSLSEIEKAAQRRRLRSITYDLPEVIGVVDTPKGCKPLYTSGRYYFYYRGVYHYFEIPE